MVRFRPPGFPAPLPAWARAVLPLVLTISLVGCFAPPWRVVEGGEDLTLHDSWTRVPQLRVEEGILTASAGEGANVVTNLQGPRLFAEGDFAVVALLGSEGQGVGAFSLVGQPGRGAWWEETQRLDVGLTQTQVVLRYYDGSTPTPAVEAAFETELGPGGVELELRRVGGTLILQVNGRQIGQAEAPDFMVSDTAYFGVSAEPETTLTLGRLLIRAPQMQEEDAVQILDPEGPSSEVLPDPSFRYSWVPGSVSGYGGTLVFDEAYHSKPASDALGGELRRTSGSWRPRDYSTGCSCVP